MRRKAICALLVIPLLPICLSDAGRAQIGMQQTIGSQSGATTSRNRPDASAALGKSGLGMVPEDFAQLKLAPGFLLSLTVLDDPDFVGAFRVDEQGDIALPVLGTLHVAGETVSEARLQIGKKLLEGKILKDPQVDLSILEYSATEVSIIGEVASPGKYPLLVPRKLVDVLALAGGTTITAGNEVQITPANSGAEPVLVHYSKATNPKAVEDAIVCDAGRWDTQRTASHIVGERYNAASIDRYYSSSAPECRRDGSGHIATLQQDAARTAH